MQLSHINDILNDENYQTFVAIFGKEQLKKFLLNSVLTKTQIQALFEDNMGVITLYAEKFERLLGKKEAVIALKKIILPTSLDKEFQTHLKKIEGINKNAPSILQKLRNIVLNNAVKNVERTLLDDGQVEYTQKTEFAVNQFSADGEQTTKLQTDAKGNIISVPSGQLTREATVEVQSIVKIYLNSYAETLLAPVPAINSPIINDDKTFAQTLMEQQLQEKAEQIEKDEEYAWQLAEAEVDALAETDPVSVEKFESTEHDTNNNDSESIVDNAIETDIEFDARTQQIIEDEKTAQELQLEELEISLAIAESMLVNLTSEIKKAVEKADVVVATIDQIADEIKELKNAIDTKATDAKALDNVYQKHGFFGRDEVLARQLQMIEDEKLSRQLQEEENAQQENLISPRPKIQ